MRVSAYSKDKLTVLLLEVELNPFQWATAGLILHEPPPGRDSEMWSCLKATQTDHRLTSYKLSACRKMIPTMYDTLTAEFKGKAS